MFHTLSTQVLTKKTIHRPQSSSFFWLCGVVIIWLGHFVPFAKANIVARFPETAILNSTINHIAVDVDGAGRVYVGAVNGLYQLGADLDKETEVRTGPEMDYSVDCLPGNCEPVERDSVNKVLAMDSSHNQLITCDILSNGDCQVRTLEDITVTKQSVSPAIASNDPEKSTVALVAPGPLNYNTVLYVAVTLTNEDFRVDTPTLSSRKLSIENSGDTLLDLVNYDISDFDPVGTFIRSLSSVNPVRPEDPGNPDPQDFSLQDRQVDYRYIFSNNGFTYFIHVGNDLQNGASSSDNLGRHTKISRVCQTSSTFKSYVQMPLKCEENGFNYNLFQAGHILQPGARLAESLNIGGLDNINVLLATFTDSTSSISALCVYSMRDIEDMFGNNIQRCYTGHGNFAARFASGSCYPFVPSNPNDYCNVESWESHFPLDGTLPVTATPLLTSIDEIYTAVLGENINSKTVAFLGTNEGVLRKVTLRPNSSTATDQYGSVTLEEGEVTLDSEVSPDLSFDSTKENIYAATRKRVYKVEVADCEQYETCQSCSNSRDPHCGWCSLENRCTKKSECLRSEVAYRWMQISGECLGVDNMSPATVSLSYNGKISFEINPLPEPFVGQYYQCRYKTDANSPWLANATVQGVYLACDVPPPRYLPTLQYPEDSADIVVAFYSSEIDDEFLRTTVTFYDCGLHTTCTSCTEAQWNCQWCIYDNVCKAEQSSCVNDGLVHDELNCPYLDPMPSPDSRLVFPSGVARSIEILGHNLPEPREGVASYQCVVQLDGSTQTRISASWQNDRSVLCDAYSYNTNYGEVISPINLVWNSNAHIPDAHGWQVTIYNCGELADDCSLCKSIESEFNELYDCKWCSDGCHYENDQTCSSIDTCTSPSINSVEPRTGPLGGNTMLTISGSNLGVQQSSIRVTVGITECAIREYSVSKRIVCLTPPVSQETEEEVNILVIGIGSTSGGYFTYQDPMPEEISPRRGPVSGGTELTITGEHLDTGADIRLLLDDDLECLPHLISPDVVLCNTPNNTETNYYDSITMQFDTTLKTLPGGFFEYLSDPTITSISPLSSFTSGGRQITVKGNNLGAVVQPKMFLWMNGVRSENANCNVTERSGEPILLCPAPNITLFASYNRVRRATIVSEVGFVMDGVAAVQDLGSYFTNLDSTFEVFADPVYYPFEDEYRVYKGDDFVLSGDRLNLACSDSEVLVEIGDETCKVKSLSETNLVCEPPKEQPSNPPGVSGSSALPLVKVTVGNLVFNLGRIEYQKPSAYFPLSAIIGIVVGGSIFIVIIIVILIIYQRKSTQAERQYRKMQIQLDTLESNVRNECKQAFAELQTEVSDLTSDLNVMGIPFWDYKTYTFKVLFPSHSDHPVLHMDAEDIHEIKVGGMAQGLQHFNQLLNSRQFLLIFIRTLESQKNFSIRDKALVASLLMIVLQDKMEYATEILKALLNELIDKSVEKHPKLMLRRTESVVEKFLTNWLSICMFGYIKKVAGRPMFMLFKAIKQQTEKGPVDAVTSEARYSLSEDRLLREKIDPKSLTIHLQVEGQQELQTCRVLDCDTITQAKEKALDAIYMNTPFSRRPSVYDIELEWRSGRSGHLPLQDEDVTTQLINGWKKINTLAHYHVADGAVMAMVPKKNTDYDMVRKVHGMIEITTGSSNSAITPIITVEEGTKVWHLVKHDDSVYANRAQKAISEIFLTRLLSTKGTVQSFVDDLFTTILKVDGQVPPAVKFLFDFLDKAARRHNIVDPEVVHIWKCNSLPLRFWVNMLKNPEFVFDIHKSHIIDSCLSVIAQTFMDACSTTEHRLTKDSPSNKLLFAKDIPKYRKMVEKFFKDVQEMPPVSESEMNAAMTDLSMQNLVDFNVHCALKELYKYAKQYDQELLDALDSDSSAQKLHLAKKFGQVSSVIDGTSLY